MLVIRLQRVGRKNDPSFRLVVTDARRAARSGVYVDMIGSYNARKKHVNIKLDRVEYWLSKGAKPSETVKNLLKKQGLTKF